MTEDQVTHDVRRALTEPEHMSDIDLIIELRNAARQYNKAHQEATATCTKLYAHYETLLKLIKKKEIRVSTTYAAYHPSSNHVTLKPPIPEIKITDITI